MLSPGVYSEEFCREPGSGLLVWEGPRNVEEAGGVDIPGIPVLQRRPGSGVPAPGPVQSGGWGPAFSRDESPPWWALLGQTQVRVCPGTV